MENDNRTVRTEWETPVMKKLSLKDAESGLADVNDDSGVVWAS